MRTRFAAIIAALLILAPGIVSAQEHAWCGPEKVIVFTQPNCVYCDMTIKFLNSIGVQAITVDYRSNAESYAATRTGTPVVKLANGYIYGYNQRAMRAAWCVE